MFDLQFRSSARGGTIATPLAFATPTLIGVPATVSSPNWLYVNKDRWDCPAPWSMTPSTPLSASMSAGAPVGIGAATWASRRMLLPVPTSRLIVPLPVLATKTYLPDLVIQQEAD